MRGYIGFLVVIEGIHSVGKTSIVNEMSKYYKLVGIPYSVYNYPNVNGIHGTQIKKYENAEIEIKSKYDVLHMYSANRLQMKVNIMKDLHDGKVVICDSYIYSAIAYNIPKHIHNNDHIKFYCKVLGHFDKHLPEPDIVYLIDGTFSITQSKSSHKIYEHRLENIKMKDKLLKVIQKMCSHWVYIKNKEDKLQNIVNYIVFDIYIRTTL